MDALPRVRDGVRFVLQPDRDDGDHRRRRHSHPGASSFEVGVRACTAPQTGTSCSGDQFAYPGSDGSYTLALAPGTWWVSGFVDVFAYPTVSQSTSPPQVITVTAGSRSKANFTVKAPTS